MTFGARRRDRPSEVGAPLIGLPKASLFNSSVSADTDIFATPLTPTKYPVSFRIYACFGTAGVLSVRRTVGGVTVSEVLNGGASLSPNCAYAFDVFVTVGDSINLRYSVSATALVLRVVEISGASW